MDKTPKADNKDYLRIGAVFFAAGVLFLLYENTRAVGIPFFILGLTFLAISQQKPDKNTPEK